MKDVKLIVYGVAKTFGSEFIGMEELPKVGEHISTIYFQQKFDELKDQKVFKVARVLHHYVDDMMGIDYTEIELERSI